MVIRRMNRVFARHGRILFTLITIVIIVTFVGFLSPGFSSILTPFGHSNVAGVAFGKNITDDQVREQARQNLLAYSLFYGAGLNNSQLTEFASQNAFPAICRLAAAARRGITVSDKEVFDFIANLPFFQNQETGRFDLERYRRYVEDTLKPNGFSETEFDESIRSFLIQQKLDEEIVASVVVTDGELRQFFYQFNEKFTVRVANFNAKDYLDEITLQDQEVKSYFELYQTNYSVPARMRALLISFDFTAPEIVGQAKAAITDDAVRDHYEKNKSQFMEFQPGQTPAVIPFEQAEKQVRTSLADKLARDIVFRNAQIFAQDAYDVVAEAPEGKLEAFKNLATEKGIELIETDWFSEDASAINGVELPKLISQLAIVDHNAPLSNAIAGNEAVYLGYLIEMEPSRPAEFGEVSLRVIKSLKNEKALAMARDNARELVARLTRLDKAERVAAVNEIESPGFAAMDPFILANPPYGERGHQIAALAEAASEGDVKLDSTTEGALVLFVEKRELPSEQEFADNKGLLADIYRRQKAGAARVAFTVWLNSKCKNVRD